MTYEKFASSMESKKELNITRKEIRKFTIRYALLLFSCTIAIATVVSSIVGLTLSIAVLILALLLYVCSFDILVETPKYYSKLSRIVRFWWLILISVIALCIVINLFII